MQYSIVSMTGYGQSIISSNKLTITVEMRSVNSRYLEIKFKMPPLWGELEDRIREIISSEISRGRVEINISAHHIESDSQVAIDWSLLESVKDAHKKIQDVFGLKEPLSFTDLLAVEGVLKVEKAQDDLEEIWILLEQAILDALNQLLAMRKSEGERLSSDIANRITYIKELVAELEKLSPIIVKEQQEKLSERVAELGVTLSEDRLEQEVALIVDKMSVTEELVRLKSHCDGFLEIMKEGERVGRKLDFLLQEMNREINTTGAKSSNLTISRLVVEIKSELEKIREQIQNIE
ncbi:MAG TPA: YicC family protein [Firmicutes bacterium]|nr:YicC family protein [Bacillota bacterium]